MAADSIESCAMNLNPQLELEYSSVVRTPQVLCDGARVLPGFAAADSPALLAALESVCDHAPFRHMVTPGGFRMSVAMTNCGSWGWVTDRRGYRYSETDPTTGARWPVMPRAFASLAARAAQAAGFGEFAPDACLINRYQPGARLTLHQDKDERDLRQPIVSVSLGLPATFQFGGLERATRCCRVPLEHGDVVVWGGPARLFHHGVLPLKDGAHVATGPYRINLTLRRAR
jgi:DNA oxidative demethylase